MVQHKQIMSIDAPLTPKEKLARMREELRESHDKGKQDYLADLDDCGVKWKNGRYRCNSVGCPRCTRKIIGQQQREARAFFADMGNPGNADMAFLTVIGDGSRDLDEVNETIEAMDKASRYRVGASRPSSLWNDFGAWGYYEVDAVGTEHYPLLGPDRQKLLAEVAPISMGQNGPTWVPSFHAIVHIGPLGIAEVRDAFARTWPVPGQVHVKPFETVRCAADNIDRLVRYALKNSCEIEIPTQQTNGCWGKIPVPWPVSWQADYFSWLHQKKNGFQFLRFSISPESPKNAPSISVPHDLMVSSRVELGPMPILF
jgi:hypothetical protein